MNRTPICVFLTGGTGFVGGNILSSLYKAHPEIHIKALLRREEDANELQSIYPNLEPVIGTLSNLTLLTSTAAEADLVIHATKEDVPAVLALIDGLSTTFAADPPTPRLISVTGTRSLIDRSLPVTGIEVPNARPWSDVTDIKTILSLPKERIHAEADQTTLAHSAAKGVGTMLISPGQLFGRGKGHLKKESASAAYYAAVKNRDRAFVVSDGSVKWSWSSTGDLGDAVVFLMEQSILKGREAQSRVGVNREGYYFVRTGDVAMKERADAVSKRLGLDEVESLPVEVVADIHPFGPIMWGCGTTFRPDRLSALGWKPKDVDWRALMEEVGGLRA